MVTGTNIQFTDQSGNFVIYRTITDGVDSGSDVTWSITLVGGSGEVAFETCSMTAEIPVADPADFVTIDPYWDTPANQPSWATVSGFIALDGVLQPFPDAVFGVDISFTPAELSEDWDFLAYSLGIDDVSSAFMRISPQGRFNIAIDNIWVNATQIAGSPVYDWSDSVLGVVATNEIAVDNADYNLATTLSISNIAEGGVNIGSIFNRIRVGDFFLISEWLDKSNYILGVFEGPGTAIALQYNFPITVLQTDGTIPDDADIAFNILPFGLHAVLKVEGDLIGASSSVQAPAGEDLPMLIEFGAAQATTNMDLAVTGEFTCNVDGEYDFEIQLSTSRLTPAQVAPVLVHAEVNGTPVGVTLVSSLANPDNLEPIRYTTHFALVDTDVVEFFFTRDLGGKDEGTLTPYLPSLASIPDVPSAWVRARRRSTLSI
jgi:hypothetical protein